MKKYFYDKVKICNELFISNPTETARILSIFNSRFAGMVFPGFVQTSKFKCMYIVHFPLQTYFFKKVSVIHKKI